LRRALKEIDLQAFDRACTTIISAVRRDGCIFTCGNGGSATTAAHLANDIAKLVATCTAFRPNARLLGANAALFTAYCNDVSYREALALEFRSAARPDDIVIAISCSGASANIVQTLAAARALGSRSVILTGNAPGAAASLADVVIKVPSSEITLQEDLHLAICHSLVHAAIAKLQGRRRTMIVRRDDAR
jgi:D-sedoheptulose 7-phosphate isomerase